MDKEGSNVEYYFEGVINETVKKKLFLGSNYTNIIQYSLQPDLER